ncbi:MAG TPA: GntG family PLP-dependent aldolase [Vicinamibacterales bacterium]|nr:GntG family PLP-dependent aldolase [Vicinamibacterales bacterium]
MDGVHDFRSDTVTLPTPAMMAAIASARLGDAARGDDPTVAALEARVRELTGKADAMLVPSGTMANLAALMAHGVREHSVVVEADAHLCRSEGDGYARAAGATLRALRGTRGILSADAVAHALAEGPGQAPQPKLVCLENTHNAGGGSVYAIAELEAICEVAHRAGVPVHVDGARLFNAAACLNRSIRELAAHADSIWFALCKGLGCPIGAVLAADAPLMQEARRAARMLGGAMRQAGLIAAPALVALDDDPIARHRRDHALAHRFASACADIDARLVDPAQVPTNIVYLNVGHVAGGADAVRFPSAGCEPSGAARCCDSLPIATSTTLRCAQPRARSRPCSASCRSSTRAHQRPSPDARLLRSQHDHEPSLEPPYDPRGCRRIRSDDPRSGHRRANVSGSAHPPRGAESVMGEPANLAINPFLYKSMPFDPAKDVVPVALVGTVPLVLVVSSTSSIDSVAALVAESKRRQLAFASSGNGTVGHLVGETFKRAARIDYLHVPYKGAGPVMTDLLGGRVDLHFASLPAALPHVKGGKLRALAVTSAKRVSQLPDVPTLAESGYPNFEYQVFYGVMAPAGTPSDRITRLNAAIERALATPALREKLANIGVDVHPGSPEQFGKFLAEERSKFGEAVKVSGAKVD